MTKYPVPASPAFILTRRGFVVSLAALAAAPALAQDAGIRIAHAYGEVVLKEPARRVVSLGYTTHDALLALGVVPIAVRYWFGDQPNAIWPWAQPYLNGETPAVIAGEVAMETIAALQPDLIVGIGSGISQEEYGVLSQIAPVLMHGADGGQFGTAWDEATRSIALAVGKSDLAEELIAKNAALFAAARERHPDWQGKTAVAAYNFSGQTGAYATRDTRGRFFADLGFVTPEAVDQVAKGEFYASLSPEDLTPLDADLLVWISSFDTVPDIVALPMRKMLDAHKEGREVFADGLVSASMSFGSILSLPYALEQLETDFALALDGDPATTVPGAVKSGLAP